MNLRLLILLCASLIVIATIPPVEVSAHTVLESTIPIDGSMSTESIRDITTTFSKEIQPFSKISVVDQDGNEIKSENMLVAAKRMTASFDPPLDSGTYIVQWQAVADDGHTSEGQFTFSIQSAIAAEPVETSETTNHVVIDEENRSSIMPYMPVIAILLVIILVLLVFLLRKPSRNSREGK